MKKPLIVLLVLLIIAAAVIIPAILFLRQDAAGIGEGRLEGWIRGRITGTVNGLLKPEMTLESFDYQHPGVVAIEGLTLTAIDPASQAPAPTAATQPASDDQAPADEQDIAEDPADARPADTPATQVILAVERATIQMDRVPQVGQPLPLREVVLESPTINLLGLDADGDGIVDGLVGLSDLLEAPSDREVGDDTVQLNEVLEMQRALITNATLFFDPRLPDQSPMLLDGLDIEVRMEPSEANDGWYAIDVQVAREPVMTVDIQGRFNLNTGQLEAQPLTLRLQLSDSTTAMLPPSLQTQLEQYEVHGDLLVELSGSLNLLDPMASTGRLYVELLDGRVAAGDYQVPVSWVQLYAELEDRAATLHLGNVVTLGGWMSLTGHTQLGDGFASRYEINAREMHIEDLLRAGEAPAESADNATADANVSPEGEDMSSDLDLGVAEGDTDDPDASELDLGVVEDDLPDQVEQRLADQATHEGRDSSGTPRFAGLANLDVTLEAPLERVMTEAAGGGHLEVRQGRLGRVPFLSDILRLTDMSILRGDREANDQADIGFVFEGDRAIVDPLRIGGAGFRITGDGEVHFNGTLDLRVGVRPGSEGGGINLTRMAGDVVGVVGDRLARIRIGGTVAEPEIGAALLGQ